MGWNFSRARVFGFWHMDCEDRGHFIMVAAVRIREKRGAFFAGAGVLACT
jgi:hypothetical protein